MVELVVTVEPDARQDMLKTYLVPFLVVSSNSGYISIYLSICTSLRDNYSDITTLLQPHCKSRVE